MEANGEVERAVKNIKNPLKTAQDSFKALLNNREWYKPFPLLRCLWV